MIRRANPARSCAVDGTLKAHLRRIGARSFTSLFGALSEICDLYTPDECWNYFREAGYAST
ncbi:hypothetical protein QEZ52_10460 [Aliisedimentitalea scapharcae]|uniref:Transposase n=1 Tax=Aliisedimentitalea scapharcae TaxID=1524259 RepID=A0ABZ2XQF6_9RHOB